MKKIAIIQDDKVESGVYNYGLSAHQILNKSSNYEYVLAPVSRPAECLRWIHTNPVDAVIYNHYPFALSWLTNEFTEEVKSYFDIPQFMITGHEHISNLDRILHFFVIDPFGYCSVPDLDKILESLLGPNGREKYFSGLYSYIPRPIIDCPDINYYPPARPLVIGSFGFGYTAKLFHQTVKLVNEQFEEPVTINFNIGLAHYAAPIFVKDAADKCRAIANPNVTLNISHDFMKDSYELIKFLNSNDINIFCYEDQPSRLGVSSCIDFALSSKKPFAFNSSSMFRHVYKDELNVDITPIRTIIENGLTPIMEFTEKWSEENFRTAFEIEFDKFLKN